MAGRVVVLVDMDCFYVQVEQHLAPETRSLPCAVVQYNSWRGGSVLAVDYVARQSGVRRGMRGKEAVATCPQLHIFRVPEKRGKADLTRYREVGAKVIQVLSRYCRLVERASVDEAFLDLSEEVAGLTHSQPSTATLTHTVVAGWEGDGGVGVEESLGETKEGRLAANGVSEWLEREGSGEERALAVAAALAQEMREAVWKETGCTCSAGIAHNKMLAKLAAGINKPNQQTILPASCVSAVFSTTPIGKIRNLGGRLGTELAQQLQIVFIGQLCGVPMATLQNTFGQKTGQWLHDVCRGVDGEPVRSRHLPQSLGCGKNFNGPAKLTTTKQIQHWLGVLSSELVERLREDQHQHRRQARKLVVHFQQGVSDRGMSRCIPLTGYDIAGVVEAAWAAMRSPVAAQHWLSEVTHLSLSASKFTSSSSQTLHAFLNRTRSHSPDEGGTLATYSKEVEDCRSHSPGEGGVLATDSEGLEDCRSHSPGEGGVLATHSEGLEDCRGHSPGEGGVLATHSEGLEDCRGHSPGEGGVLATDSEGLEDCRSPSPEKGRTLGTDSEGLDECRSHIVNTAHLTGSNKRPHSEIQHHHSNRAGKRQRVGLMEVDYSSKVGEDLEYPSDVEGGVEYPSEVMDVCCECGETVPVWLAGEHADYHLAMRLQQEDAHPQAQSTAASSSSSSPWPQSAGQGKTRAVQRRQSRTLQSFFHKK